MFQSDSFVRHSHRRSSAGMMMVVLFLLCWCNSVSAAESKNIKPRVIFPVKQAVSRPVHALTPPVRPLRAPEGEAAQWIGYPDRRGGQVLRQPQAPVPDASLQQSRPVAAMPAASVNFEGLNNIAGVYPPDTCGDVGPNHYVQITNLYFRIFDKTGTPLTPALANNSLWAGFGGVCESTNHGDPIVLYDQFSDRWLLSQFSIDGPYHQCIAISQSGDPTGAWYLYDYEMSTTVMNDYPKFGVWPDGYYMAINQFDSTNSFNWAGQGAVVFDRSTMLAGGTAAMIYLDLGASHPELGAMLPSDADGLASPPAGTPNYFVQFDDDGWGYPADQLEVYEFHVDWATPANSTFTPAAASPLAVSSFATLDNINPTVPQPGTTQKLQNLGDRLMYRLQYRNFGSHQAMVVNHTVDTGAGVAGIRWYELRDTGSGWAIEQQGTYGGDSPDGQHRWMGSLAMDGQGNMALGYSLSSTTTYPSIRYAGRLAGDAAGSMGQGESEIVAGSGSQTGSAARWGDYSMMSVDPVDECTFWYTQEYYATTSNTGWQTRVAAFSFPSCTAAASGTLSGTVTAAGGSPLAGATVTADDGALVQVSTLTAADGSYSFASLPGGNYTVTAAKFGYVSTSVSGITVIAGTTTTLDLTLAVADVHTLSGTVTDAATGWPLYAEIDYGLGSVWTDPGTGGYSVDLPAGSYSLTATAAKYDGDTATVDLNGGNAAQDFTLQADATCSAPGYYLSTPTILLSENFDGCALPAGWTINNLGGVCDWIVSNPDPGSDGNLTGGTGCFADADSDACGSGTTMNTELVSPAVDCSGMATVTLQFKYDVNEYGSRDTFAVDVSIDNGATWTNVWQRLHVDDRGPKTATVDISAIASGQASVQVRFHYIAPGWDWWWQVDEVSLTGAPCNAPADGGFVVGNVFDANTGLGLNGAVVDDGLGHTVTTIATPDDPSLADGFYSLYLPSSGTVDLTASRGGSYGTDTRSVAVPVLGSVAQDFSLAAGMLGTDPTAVEAVVVSGGTDNRSVLLTNDGTASAAFTIIEINAPPPARPAGPYAVPVRHMSPKGLDLLDASTARYDFPVPAVPVIAAAGAVVQSWTSGMAYPWGIGHQNDTVSLWLGNLSAAGLGGGDLDQEFSLAGAPTGRNIDVAGLGGASWMADQAYDWINGTLWQVAVGGDNCIHELDPVAMTATGSTICPAFGTSQRGLAYNPETDTFFAGSWSDSTIHEFDRSGAILRSTNVGLAISGLAFNPLTDHLFVMVNGPAAEPEVYVVNVPASGDFVVSGQFDTAAFTNDYSGAGLAMGCDGHLWAVDQSTQTVHEIDSGETGTCSLDIPWLTVSPASGSVAPANSGTVNLEFNAAGLTPGETKKGFLIVNNDTPYGSSYLPVTLRVMPLPIISSTGYSGVKKDAVTVEALVDPQCQATEYYFEYGTVPGVYDQRTASIFSSSCSPVSISALLEGLKSGTAYYVRLVATNAAGTSYSTVMLITTDAFPWPMFLPAISGATN